jgi:hypothetical protein
MSKRERKISLGKIPSDGGKSANPSTKTGIRPFF